MLDDQAWLRPWTVQDAGVVESAAGRSPELWDQLPPREKLMELFYAPTNGSNDRWTFAICTPGGPVGNVALRKQGFGDGVCSYWLVPEARGRGLATRSVVAVCDYGLHALGMYRIELSHRTDNPASAAVARRCGFTREGVRRGELLLHGQRYDTCLWSLLKTDPHPQPDPLPLQS